MGVHCLGAVPLTDSSWLEWLEPGNINSGTLSLWFRATATIRIGLARVFDASDTTKFVDVLAADSSGTRTVTANGTKFVGTPTVVPTNNWNLSPAWNNVQLGWLKEGTTFTLSCRLNNGTWATIDTADGYNWGTGLDSLMLGRSNSFGATGGIDIGEVAIGSEYNSPTIAWSDSPWNAFAARMGVKHAPGNDFVRHTWSLETINHLISPRNMPTFPAAATLALHNTPTTATSHPPVVRA